MSEHCEVIYTDDGGEALAVVRVSDEITDEGRVALRDLIDAAKRRFEADLAADPSIAERQSVAEARNRERLARVRARGAG